MNKKPSGKPGAVQFPDLKTAEKTNGAVMEHYNSVAGAMTRSLWCEPIYEIDPNSDEVLWEPWVDGLRHRGLYERTKNCLKSCRSVHQTSSFTPCGGCTSASGSTVRVVWFPSRSV